MNELEQAAVAREAGEPAREPGVEKRTELDDIANVLEMQKDKGRRRVLREFVETVVLTVVIFTAINALTGRFRIEGPSMLPSLYEGQYLIINKFVYKLHPPRRGDIVVFHHPLSPNRDLIKRVVGLPGEMVEIRQGQVHIDGIPLEEPYVTRPARYSSSFELGPNEFFVLGDNRPNSDDSHNWGVLDADQIVGKAWVSYWPPGDWGGVPHYSFPENTTARGVSPMIGVRNTVIQSFWDALEGGPRGVGSYSMDSVVLARAMVLHANGDSRIRRVL